jgi:hypothetical protein
MYWPAIGRFVSADTIVPGPGNPQALNRYSYVRNSPLMRVDPDGHLDIISLIAGFSDQYTDNMTLGLHSSMNVDVAERMRNTNSTEYTIGRVAADIATLIGGGSEAISGGSLAAVSVAGGVGCMVATVGACVPVGAGVAAGGAAVGGAMVMHGTAVVVSTLSHAGDTAGKLFIATQAGENSQQARPRIAGTRGLDHSFDEHASQWFGRPVSKNTHLQQWQSLIEQASRSKETFAWKTGDAKTVAHLARIDGKYFVVQFFVEGERAGELATAFVPGQDQLTSMFSLLGR